MIPSHSDPALQEQYRETVQPMPSLTWRIDQERKRITGKIDALDAMKQAVFKILQTDRFWHYIYSDDYGHELKLLIGNHPLTVRSEAVRLLEEALLQDERILDITDMNITVEAEQLTIHCTVRTEYGEFAMEVTRDV
ncbi:DUF2634 domain-containing protein [Paenibacillus yanchengensis]|uniref:DUF2634 domain-containing protein n=1 Tax=Paenibacillus yanchengensis TaxID=2035833 RepID=A0ABW4YNJ8_9BACL